MKTTKITIIVTCSVMSIISHAQTWQLGGNNNLPALNNPANQTIGTNVNRPLRVETNGIQRAIFTVGTPLTTWNGNFGDGLRILDISGTNSHLDLFTSSNAGGSETHIRFGGSGQVSGQNNRFEFISTNAALGNYYSTFTNGGIHRFDRGQTEYGRLGSNNFWRFGQNNSGPVFGGQNANRMVEVVDDAAQFRLTFSPNGGGPFTDFFSNATGNLQILPQNGRMGVNVNANPSHNLDVNGNARIRNVSVDASPDAIIVGNSQTGAGDLEVRRLDFTGSSNDVLLGNGTWGPAPSSAGANNGISIAGGNMQLGGACNNLTQLIASGFTNSRAIFLNGNSFWLYSGQNQNGGVGLGAQPASAAFCGVGNTVEISANNQSAYGNTNASGLRFTKLTSNSPTTPNGTNGVDNSRVLTVDQNGDVVLTDASPGGLVSADNGLSVNPTGNVQLGQDVGAVGNPGQLLNNREIPMNNFNLVFTDAAVPTAGTD